MSAEEQTPNVQSPTPETDAPGNASEGSGAVDTVDVKPSVLDDEYVRLRVITSEGTNEIHFRVKPHTPLVRMKNSYSKKLGMNADELRFVFDGHRITDDDTPSSLGLINDDVIEIYQERVGGM